MNDAKTALGLKIRAVKKHKGWSWAEVAERLERAIRGRTDQVSEELLVGPTEGDDV